jgi:polyferredoxin
MKKRIVEKRRKEESGALFIPAGIFLGLGFGFLYNDLVAGLFIGMGVGFILFAITALLKRRRQ